MPPAESFVQLRDRWQTYSPYCPHPHTPTAPAIAHLQSSHSGSPHYPTTPTSGSAHDILQLVVTYFSDDRGSYPATN
jgi:hypothetical protein